jgi:hypothetical protein
MEKLAADPIKAEYFYSTEDEKNEPPRPKSNLRFGEVSCRRYIGHEVRSVRKLFNREGLRKQTSLLPFFVRVTNI